MKAIPFYEPQRARLNTLLPSCVTAPKYYTPPKSSLEGMIFDFHEEHRVAVVDNHKYAAYCWYNHIVSSNGQAFDALVHVDKHLDNVLREFTIGDHLSSIDSMDNFFKYVSQILSEGDFIWPAAYLGFFEEILFVGPDHGVNKPDAEYNSLFPDRPIKSRYESIQNIHNYALTGNSILDLDLDYFYQHGSISSTTEEELEALHKQSWRYITVALSPKQCGGLANSLQLLNMFYEAFSIQRI